MHVTSLGAAREIQEGIAVDPLLVGCGVKPHDVKLLGRKAAITPAVRPHFKMNVALSDNKKATVVSGFYLEKNQSLSDSV
ncbi:hypothetical protein [Shewanella sp. FDAARGOS_354]|uniref:hypothetical protein n=1 Tax=Shewanella sp. FDAARGOS_354 TaxID=1930557 RepID=UPI000B51D003|nr:hypothetical protein [Shewanella sp. FDAARGOS_354]ASF17002.1 hypothetical protein CEQ32_19670 [Shewanella sp. FDAARGOS_354]MBW0278716.1 hypothetical protein [Shewanella xiamenensis]